MVKVSYCITKYDRINRYIMECKSPCAYCFNSSILGINRYIMECKCHSASYPLCSISELIDTLWNVNYTLNAIPVASNGN